MTCNKSKTTSLDQAAEQLTFVASVLRELSRSSLDAKLALGDLNKVRTALKQAGSGKPIKHQRLDSSRGRHHRNRQGFAGQGV